MHVNRYKAQRYERCFGIVLTYFQIHIISNQKSLYYCYFVPNFPPPKFGTGFLTTFSFFLLLLFPLPLSTSSTLDAARLLLWASSSLSCSLRFVQSRSWLGSAEPPTRYWCRLAIF